MNASGAHRSISGEGKEDTAYRQGKLDAFEKGMGVMLRNAWSHVEALQTTDLPLLVSHVAAVLQLPSDPAPFSAERRLEFAQALRCTAAHPAVSAVHLLQEGAAPPPRPWDAVHAFVTVGGAAGAPPGHVPEKVYF